LLTLKRVLLAGVNHIENFNGHNGMAVNQNVVWAACQLVRASNATTPIPNRKYAQTVRIPGQPINQLLRRNRIEFCNEPGNGLPVLESAIKPDDRGNMSFLRL